MLSKNHETNPNIEQDATSFSLKVLTFNVKEKLKIALFGDLKFLFLLYTFTNKFILKYFSISFSIKRCTS